MADAGDDKYANLKLGGSVPVSFNANNSHDPDGDTLDYYWDFDSNFDTDEDGDPSNDRNAMGEKVTYNFTTGGNRSVTLTVVDPYGVSDNDTIKAYINYIPIVNIEVSGTVMGDTYVDEKITFSAEGSYDPDDDLNGNGLIDGSEVDGLTYSWDFYDNMDKNMDGNYTNDTDALNKMWLMKYPKPGDYLVTLNVWDNPGHGYRAYDHTSVELVVLEGSPPPPALVITSPRPFAEFTPGENIAVYGTSLNVLGGTNITVSIDGTIAMGTIDNGGDWSVTVIAPNSPGNYYINASTWPGLSTFVMITVTDTDSTDSDHDGYNDTYENESGSDPYDAKSTPDDRDGDGYPNAEEDGSGSDPDNAGSTPLDWDGDGIPNDEDEYPYDPSNTKRKAEQEKDYRAILIFIGIGFILIILALVIYTRLKRKRIPENETRNTIYAYINRNPGAHYRKIKEKLSISDSTLTHHVRKLRETEMIRVKYAGNFKLFYPTWMEEEPSPMTPIQKKILGIIRERPGTTIRQIAFDLGKKPRTVRYHVNNIADMGLIDSKNIDNRTHWFETKGTMQEYVSNEELT